MRSLVVLIGALVLLSTVSCNVQRTSINQENVTVLNIASFSTKDSVWYKSKGAQNYLLVGSLKGRMKMQSNTNYNVMGLASGKELAVQSVLSETKIIVDWKDLEGKWQFVYVEGSNADVAALSKMQVNVTEKGLSGNLACNRFSCVVNMSGTSFAAGSIPTTKRMCFKMDIERATLIALRSAKQIEAYQDRIELYAEGKLLLGMVRLK